MYQELFDFIAVAVESFVLKHPESKDEMPEKELGFILSYPVNQAVLLLGTAIKWKSFSADDTVEFTLSDFSFMFGQFMEQLIDSVKSSSFLFF